MRKSQRETAASLNIDALMQETWLQAISLRYGPPFKEGEGRRLWQRCSEDVTRVQAALRSAGLDDASCQHILYAQCALLDEVVKGRGIQDDACRYWYDRSLQAHFLGTTEAGERLCERMRHVLRSPVSHRAVLTCFHRVMLLGFLGEYRMLDDTRRRMLVKTLSERVAPFSYRSITPIRTRARSQQSINSWLASWPARIGLSVLLMGILWLECDYWLDQMLFTLLPVGTMK